jgi:hypothetical protein
VHCWVTKAADTHWEYVILIAVGQQRWLRERALILRYTYVTFLVNFSTGFAIQILALFQMYVRYSRYGKAMPIKAYIDPEGFRRLRLPGFFTVGT